MPRTLIDAARALSARARPQLSPECAYLSVAPDGSPYELRPTLANLSAAAGMLLGQSGWDSLSQLQRYWNDEHAATASMAASGGGARVALCVDESRSGAYRPQVGRPWDPTALRAGVSLT